MKKLVLETTAPFQGLAELVAFHEGLFEEQGLKVEWADRDAGNPMELRTDVHDPEGLDRIPATESCSSRVRRICTTPANGGIIVESRTAAWKSVVRWDAERS